MAEPSAEAVVFATAIEGFKRAFARQLTPELRAECKGLGIDFDHIQPAYTLTTWLKVIDRLALAVVPEAEPSARYRHLGQAFMRGFVETPIGIALHATARLVGPKRAMLRMGRNLRTAANYIDVDTVDVAPTRVDIRTSVPEHFREKVRAHFAAVVPYRQGVLEETARLVGVTAEVRVLVANADVVEATYNVTWGER